MIFTTYEQTDDAEYVEIERDGRRYRAYFETDLELAMLCYEHQFTWREVNEVLADVRMARRQGDCWRDEWDDNSNLDTGIKFAQQVSMMDRAAHYRINMLCGWVMLLSIGFVAFVVLGM